MRPFLPTLVLLGAALTACAGTRERPAARPPAGALPRLAVFTEAGGRFSIAYPARWSAAQQDAFPSVIAISPELLAMKGGGGSFSVDFDSYGPSWTAADRVAAADSNARAESADAGDGPGRQRVASSGPARLGALPAFRLVVTGNESLGRKYWYRALYVADLPDGSGQVVFDCGEESHDPSLCDRLAATFALGPPD